MGVNYKHLAETRGKMVEEYQEVIVPRYTELVHELRAENKQLREELMDEKYRHDRQADFTVAQGKIIDDLKAENAHIKKLLELARGERDVVTKRMIELEIKNENQGET